MSSASSLTDARLALEAFLAGRARAERVVVAVAEAYYKARGGSQSERERLRPVLQVIERAAPGVVALGRIDGGAGFDIKLAERPFPKSHEAALREAAGAVLRTDWSQTAAASGELRESGSEKREMESAPQGPVAAPAGGFLARLVNAVRRLFSAST